MGGSLSATKATGLGSRIGSLELAQSRADSTIAALREAYAKANFNLVKTSRDFKLLEEFHNNFKSGAVQRQKELARDKTTLQAKVKDLTAERDKLAREKSTLGQEQKEKGIRAYKKAVLEELSGTDLSKVDKRFPDIFKG